jgi:hypothetical protein
VSTRTVLRWDERPELGFPPVVYIGTRRFRELAKLEAWDRHNARKAAAAITAVTEVRTARARGRKPAAADSGEATLK